MRLQFCGVQRRLSPAGEAPAAVAAAATPSAVTAAATPSGLLLRSPRRTAVLSHNARAHSLFLGLAISSPPPLAPSELAVPVSAPVSARAAMAQPTPAPGRPSTAFVTGGSGFVGRNLIARLTAEGVRVKALARSVHAGHKVEVAGAEAVMVRRDRTTRIAAAMLRRVLNVRPPPPRARATCWMRTRCAAAWRAQRLCSTARGWVSPCAATCTRCAATTSAACRPWRAPRRRRRAAAGLCT